MLKCVNECDSKKEYLMSYRNIKNRERRICNEIQRLQSDKIVPDAAGWDPPEDTRICDLPDYCLLLRDEVNKLQQERLDKIRMYRDIEERIRQMPCENEKEVLRLRYLTGMSWEDVAEEMSYSCQHIHRIHALALKNF